MLSEIKWPSLDALIHAEVSFEDVGALVGDLYSAIVEHENFASLWSHVASFLEVLGVTVTFVLLALSLVELLFGKKLIGVQKFLFFFAVGFAAGTSLLAPVFVNIGMKVFPWLVGIVIGAVAALFSKLLFYVVYIVVFGYSTYMIFMGGHLLPDTLSSFVKGNMIIALVATAVVIALVIILRKWVELLGTAALGGYCTALCVKEILLSLASVTLDETVFLVIFAILSVIGLGVQMKTGKSKR